MRLIRSPSLFTATKCFLSISAAPQLTSLQSAPMYQSALFHIPVLYQDAQLIVINKPPNMMSVPGKEVLTMMNVRPRSEQWRNAIGSLLEQQGGHKRPLGSDVAQDDKTRAILQQLLDKGESVPRKEDRFKRYLQRFLKVTDEGEQDRIFRAIQSRDDELHRICVSTIPAHLLSASDVASHLASEYVCSPVDYTPVVEPPTRIVMKTPAATGVANSNCTASTADTTSDITPATQKPTGLTEVITVTSTEPLPVTMQIPAMVVQQQKVHHVHRLDMETSGVLMFAKDEHISACIDAQFRDREVRVCLLLCTCITYVCTSSLLGQRTSLHLCTWHLHS